MVTSDAQEAKPEARDDDISEEPLKAEPMGNLPRSHDDTGGYHVQNRATASSSGLLAQENSNSILKGHKNHESSETYHYQSLDRHHPGPHSHDSINSEPTNSFSSDVYRVLARKDVSSGSRNKNDLYALVPHKPQELSGVLDSLKQAKLSLQQKLDRLPLVEGGYNAKSIKPLASAHRSEDRIDVPIGCSCLFRLPTDFSDKPPARSNILNPASHMSSNFYLEKEISRTPSNQFGTSPFNGTGTRFSLDNRSLATTYLESGPSRSDTKKSAFDPFDAGVPSSGKNMYPTYPAYPSYQNLTPQIPLSDGLSRPYPSGSPGVPPSDHFSFYDGHVRPNMYR